MKILLAGDVWAEGLAEAFKKTNPHYQIEQVNIDALEFYKGLATVDFALVIPSDPLLKDFMHNPWFDDYDHLLQIQNEKVNMLYTMLNKIFMHGKSFYLMGGTNKIDPDIANYANLINLCESIPNYLEPNWNHPEVYFAKNSIWYPINPDTPQETIERLIQDCDVWGNLFRSEYFKIHQNNWYPNDNGYEKIVEMVKEKLNLP